MIVVEENLADRDATGHFVPEDTVDTRIVNGLGKLGQDAAGIAVSFHFFYVLGVEDGEELRGGV